MYAKGKGSSVPSDAQAREKLALYVYEYLLHVGAQKSAQTFLSESGLDFLGTGIDYQNCGQDRHDKIRWEKNITLGEPPGFLHSWWCVFWDLYCAAPERRDTCDHSSEAKAFHDYNPAAPSPIGQMPNQDGMPGGPGMPPGFFPPFMSPRYPGGPRGPGIRMPPDQFNGPPGSAAGQMPMPNSMEPRPGHPGMGPMQRMSHPGSRMSGPMNPVSPINPAVYDSMGPSYGPAGIRGPPPNSMSPGGPGPGGMPPMSLPGGGSRWPPSSSSSSSIAQGPPGTPIMPSPQGTYSTSSGDGMYGMMKPGQGSIPGMPPGFPGMGPGGGEGGMGMGPDGMPPVMNGDMDGMKNSPANGPGTPRDDIPQNGNGPGPDMGGYPNLGGYPDNEGGESAAILKIKESMQEEAKRFEKDGEHPDYYMSQ
ncbi:single-stranded DNA-binding protein 3-like isoform X4 [Ruditapes philippinarum]|uniref:single-stranded DNA-binding protein 3-like isoform X4 n=2 Tax=Ruditapes philippinarum TaxID=129788 RepID=UPI00295BF18A|nr:single-stranded DNA-binding protein 3-like isoform X4 [Ruditapes philippinarum]